MCSAQPTQMSEAALALVMMTQGDHVHKNVVVIVDHFIVEKPEASGD